MAKTEIIQKTLYNGDVEINFYPKSHIYKKNGERLLSVSSICGIVDKSGPLMYWATNLAKEYLLGLVEKGINGNDIIEACSLHNKKKEEAGSIGKQAHERAENYIKNNEISLPNDESVCNSVFGFLQRVKENDVKFLESEKLVYSRKHNYVGILDAIATINGKNYLIDFKTSNKIRKFEYGMQTSAYMMAYDEEMEVKQDSLDGIIIVRFDKYIPESEILHISRSDSYSYFEAFENALGLKKAQKILDV